MIFITAFYAILAYIVGSLGVSVGTKVRSSAAPLSRSAPTDTGVLHITGQALKGPTDVAVKIESMSAFERFFGGPIANSTLYWELYWLFQEGLRTAYVSRVIGSGAVAASASLSDGTAEALHVAARSVGTHGNALNVITESTTDDPAISGSQFALVITHDTDGVLETTPIFDTVAEAVAWSQNSDHVILTPGIGTGLPVRVASPGTSLASGTNGATLDDAAWGAAALRHVKDNGPGQVKFSDRTSTVGYGQLLDLAAATNRHALLDPPDTTSKATLMGAVAAVRSHQNARFGSLWGPWIRYPGPTNGTFRDLPASVLVAGAMSRNDAAGVSPNQPSGGDLGDSRYALDVKAVFPSEADRSDLNEGSVNLIVVKNGVVRIYGNRTLVSREANPDWYQVSNSRFYMRIAALADNILEGYVLKKIDGKRILFSQLEGELIGMLRPFFDDGSLFGETEEEAFLVDTQSVNTRDTIALNQINASIQLVMSDSGEVVTLTIIKRRTTG